VVNAAILWDFDGTLAFRAGRWSECLLEALTSLDPDHGITGPDLAPGLRDGFPWHRPEADHLYLNSPDAWWEALHPVFHGACLRAGIDEPVATAAARAFRSHYIDPARWTVFPDAVAVLEELAEAGWAHAIVSNHVPELEELIGALGLSGHFTAVINSALIGWEKPNPRIFEAALDRLGHPQQVWMVGDNPVADIAGAGALGIPGICVRPHTDGLRTSVRVILDGAPARSSERCPLDQQNTDGR
jgi:putative hydrolase of the HAD superfamily